MGKQRAVELALIALLCEGHILVEDVPGVGKTSLVSALAKSVECPFRRIQFTPDIMPSDITGFSMFNSKSGDFEYRKGLVFSSFILADEINRASPKTQSSLLEAMEEGQVTVDNHTYRLPAPFMVMATQNSTEFVGTYPLPEAQMDRFLLRISIGYPEHEEEIAILKRFNTDDPLENLSPVCHSADIILLQKAVREVYVDESLYDYIVKLVHATRNHKDIQLGASPRGSLSLLRASQAMALYKGREYVTPDDIKPLIEPVLGHRITLTQEARIKKVKHESLLKDITQGIPVPTGRKA